MPNNNTKKIFKGLIARTKIYLIVIAVLLVLISILTNSPPSKFASLFPIIIFYI